MPQMLLIEINLKLSCKEIIHFNNSMTEKEKDFNLNAILSKE